MRTNPSPLARQDEDELTDHLNRVMTELGIDFRDLTSHRPPSRTLPCDRFERAGFAILLLQWPDSCGRRPSFEQIARRMGVAPTTIQRWASWPSELELVTILGVLEELQAAEAQRRQAGVAAFRRLAERKVPA
jgi:hypothetical protein